MDFYKKIVKSSRESVGNILSEKECKCESLQAIINEAVKENNKKNLKELVEEINSHLVNLRNLGDDIDIKSNERKERLIKLFEECLFRIVNNSSLSILNPLNAQLQELQNLTNLAISDHDIIELQKLAVRMEKNIEVMKEIPEVKSARNSQNNDDKTLEIYNKYASLLNKVLSQINVYKKGNIIGPGKENEKSIEESKQIVPIVTNHAGLNEIEEKIKQMRLKRRNRLSTFVDEQSNLSEQRKRESLKKNLVETLESSNQPTTFIQSNENIKPLIYKAAVVEKKYGENGENGETNLAQGSDKHQVAFIECSYSERASSKVSNLSQDFNYKKSQLEPNISANENRPLQPLVSKREPPSFNRGSFGQKSLAERQIDHARMQVEKPKVPLKTSSSAKTTPPRTPTQIRKLFNSFNCVQKSTTQHKSIEDLPEEFKSPFEQELKNVHLKTTGFKVKLENPIMQNDESFLNNETKPVFKSDSLKYRDKPVKNLKENDGKDRGLVLLPTIPPRKTKPTEEKRKSETAVRKNDALKPDTPVYEVIHYKDNDSLGDGVIDRNASQGQVTPSELTSHETSKSTNSKWRSSLETGDPIKTGITSEPNINLKEPVDVAIVIKREGSATPVQLLERNSFSTFRNSSDNSNNYFAINNPIYGVITKDSIYEENKNISKLCSSKKESNEESFSERCTFSKDEPTKQINASLNTLDFFIAAKRGRKSSYKKEGAVENNKFVVLQPDIVKLEFAIGMYKGLKSDEDYATLDKMLSKYYVKIAEIPASTSFENIKKESLMERLNQAHKDLKNRVERNEEIMRDILEEQVVMIAQKYGIAK